MQKKSLNAKFEGSEYKNIKAAVNEYKSFLERLSKRSLPMINRHVHSFARFKDPFFYDGDLDQRTELMSILCHSAAVLKIRVSEVLWSETPNKVFFKWTIRLEKDMAELEGVSEITFDESFMIISQNDYWDSASTVWAANPILRWMFNRGKKRLFGHMKR